MDIPTGFAFHESESVPEGYYQLDVILTDEPTGRYFDVHRVTLPRAEDHAVSPEHVEHPWRGPDSVRIGPGHVRLTSHSGEVDEAFTFGGTAGFTVEGQRTVCRVNSDAPIYHHGDDQRLASYHLVDELEALLARRQAHYAGHAVDYAERLNRVDPRQLFYACLAEIGERLSANRGLTDDPTLRRVSDLINRTRTRLVAAGEWPDVPPRLDDIL